VVCVCVCVCVMICKSQNEAVCARFGLLRHRERIMTYGTESLTLTNKIKTALMMWERKILRKIYGPIYENGFWGTKMNQDFYNRFKSSGIETVIEYVVWNDLDVLQVMVKGR